MTAAARKKFIALLLVLALLFSLLPAAFAADGEGANSGGTEASSDPAGSSEGGDPDDNGTTGASTEPTGSSEGGENGGNIVVTGTPEEVAQCKDSHTGRFLAEKLAV